MIPNKWLDDAQERIRPYILETPLTYDKSINSFLKWENHQITGSFKARGALNKVLSLEKWEQTSGLIAASAGNHGQGVALAGQIIDTDTIIFVPEHTPLVKIDAIRKLNADVILIPGGYEDAEKIAKKTAEETGKTWISPYNDGQVICGQGTIASEIFNQQRRIPNFDPNYSLWLVPTSGGGLLSGIALALKRLAPQAIIIGVQAETSPFLYTLFHKGSQEKVKELPSIAEGLAGPVEIGSITIPIIKQYVDDILLVSEEEIADTIRYTWHRYQEKIEGSAAVSLAAILNGKITHPSMVVIITGGNIEDQLFKKLLITT